MKPWLICVTTLVTGAVHSQTYTVPSNTSQKAMKYTPSMLKAKDQELKTYFSLTATSGVYPLIGITSYPVARFQYQYAVASDRTLNYADSLNSYAGSSKNAITFGFEWGKKKGVFFNTALGGFPGMATSKVKTLYFTNSIGYNIQTGISGLVLQPSIGWAKASVTTRLSDIQQNKSDILTFNETFRYKKGCGCTADYTSVTVHNSTNFVQTKLALKYNISRVISLSIGGTYYIPLRNSLRIALENKNDYTTRSGYVTPSVTAAHDDAKRDSALRFYGEATLAFNMNGSSKKRHRRFTSHSVNHSGGHSYYGGVHISGCH